MPNIFRKQVELRIGQLRISRSELARRLGVTPAVVGQTLNEDRTPREATVDRWAEALETTPKWLLGEDLAPPAPAPGPTNAQVDALLNMARALGVAETKLSALRAVIRADVDEIEPVLHALKPVFDRTAKENKRGSSTA